MIAADRYVKDHTDDLFELPVDQQEFQRTQAFSGCELVHDTHRLALMNAMLHDIGGPIYLGDTLSNFGKGMKEKEHCPAGQPPREPCPSYSNCGKCAAGNSTAYCWWGM